MRFLPRILAALALGGLLVLLVYGVVKKAPSDRVDTRLAEQLSTPAPSFKLAVVGKPATTTLPQSLRDAIADGWLTTRELRGQPVVLNFWASWCAPCREEARFLERTSRAAARDGVVFVGINVLDIKKYALEFMSEFDVTYLNVRDPSLETANSFGTKAMPETYFLTSGGDIVAHVIGVISPERMASGLIAAKSGRPIAATSGGAQRAVDEK